MKVLTTHKLLATIITNLQNTIYGDLNMISPTFKIQKRKVYLLYATGPVQLKIFKAQNMIPCVYLELYGIQSCGGSQNFDIHTSMFAFLKNAAVFAC